MTAAALAPLHGSYLPDDCQFLLTPIEADYLTIEEKERRIQSGQAHYSEMIHRESAPSPRYLALFETLCERYAPRLANEVRQLASQIVADLGHSDTPLVLVSLVRAGTPAGALLRRALINHEHQACHHYSVSIIRDRGIDSIAMDYLLDDVGVDPRRVVFVDAWTAKGVITRELRQDIARYNDTRRARNKDTIVPRLAVISDIGGTADYAATCEDYAIPSGILNATVSGLVSRSVLNHRVPAGAFHGCVVYHELAEHDRSQAFIEHVAAHLVTPSPAVAPPSDADRTRQQALMQAMLDRIQRDYAVHDINHIKPGIAEATRVMLRRVPALLMVRDPAHPDVEHLLLLAEEKGVAIEVRPDMPFHACSLIQALVHQEAP
ncbi:cysteine protease StiP family protein [Modicisalibacter coralii]|uniref:cysteine protease StiP family protein n=1 Tax=Modicisalibacter coralii TaxID=2304602 RepID=UPI00100BDD58|nr:cysteine protease StiP family protein [Halomonas coralii]